MSTEAVAAIFTALGAIAAAGIMIIPQRQGWRSRVQKDLDIFYRLFPLSGGAADDIVLYKYKRSIFSNIEKGLRPSGMRRSVGSVSLVLLVTFAVGIAINYLAGIPITQGVIATMLIFMALGSFIGWAIAKILLRFPKTDRNPFYRLWKENEELKAQAAQFKEEMEKEYKDEGWVSNYTAYLLWRRYKWGTFLYQNRVGEDRDAADRDDRREDDVEAGEDDEKGSDVSHDDLQGERDADDGNATEGVGKDG